MAIEFVIDETIDQLLAIVIQTVVIRAIRVVGPIPWVVHVRTGFDGILFSVSVRSPNGRELFAVLYTSPHLPQADELESSFNAGEYSVPEHPFLSKLEGDLFERFMRFKLNVIVEDHNDRRQELADLAHWLNHDRDPIDVPEGLLSPPQMTVEPGRFEAGPTIMYNLDPDAHPWPSKDFATVQVHFGTNRAANNLAQTADYFTAQRGTLRFGTCEVTIPWKEHVLGNVERPKWWRLQLREDPTRHLVLKAIEDLSRDAFRSRLAAEIAEHETLLTFVHGYNVTFAEAARRTAQVKFDLGFAGPVVMFSWPSLGTLFGYAADEATAEWSIPDFSDFLELLLATADPHAIHLIAHSMGNRITTRALERMAIASTKTPSRVQQVFLAAPDIDSATFLQLAKQLKSGAKRVTLYGSSSDRAIGASRVFHNAPRAGEGGDRLLIDAALDSIDATVLDSDLVGHSYVTDSPAVLADIHELIKSDRRPAERFGLRARPSGGWMFVARVD